MGKLTFLFAANSCGCEIVTSLHVRSRKENKFRRRRKSRPGILYHFMHAAVKRKKRGMLRNGDLRHANEISYISKREKRNTFKLRKN